MTTATTPSTRTNERLTIRAINDTECRRLFDVMCEFSDAVNTWYREGCAREDVDPIAVPNAMKSLAFRPAYQSLRNELMAKYDTDEVTLVGAVLHRFASDVPSKGRRVLTR